MEACFRFEEALGIKAAKGETGESPFRSNLTVDATQTGLG